MSGPTRFTDVAFFDCVFPNACECLARGYPHESVPHASCIVPTVNALALAIGWKQPYPTVPAADLAGEQQIEVSRVADQPRSA